MTHNAAPPPVAACRMLLCVLSAAAALSLCSCGSLTQHQTAGRGEIPSADNAELDGPELTLPLPPYEVEVPGEPPVTTSVATAATPSVSVMEGFNALIPTAAELAPTPASLFGPSVQPVQQAQPIPVTDLGVLTQHDEFPPVGNAVQPVGHMTTDLTIPTMQGLAHETPWIAGDVVTDEVVICDTPQSEAVGEESGLEIIAGPLPLPHRVVGPWNPPGFTQPWPEEEYLWDGGDLEPRAEVSPDWSIQGLEPEDTIVHFDTVDGHVRVQPSNRVHLYAPRFAAVRLVTGANVEHQIDAPRGYEMQKPFGQLRENQLARHSVQHDAAQRQVGRKRVTTYRDRDGWQEISSRLVPLDFHDAFLPYENNSVIRRGKFEQLEKPRLAEAVQAAVTWSGDQAAQVVLDGQQASEVVLDRQVGHVHRFDKLPGRPCLRVIKVASTHYAQPGEHVDFTIRFDNVGDEVVGNVTVVDNLTTRLEYVADSAQSSVTAKFSAQENEHGSSVLRWEVEAPLKPGDGGVVRFRCLVR